MLPSGLGPVDTEGLVDSTCVAMLFGGGLVASPCWGALCTESLVPFPCTHGEGPVNHGSLHIDSLICYLLSILSHIPLYILYTLYTPVSPVYPC